MRNKFADSRMLSDAEVEQALAADEIELDDAEAVRHPGP
jgi:hypothetical protein